MYRKGDVPKHREESELIVHSWTRKGFFGSYANIYKTHNPGEPIRWDTGLGPASISVDECEPSDHQRPDGKPMRLLSNGNITLAVSRRGSAMPYCWRNADADELFFVHRGEARFETELGLLSAEPGDFVYLPRNIVYRLVPQTPENLFLILETRSLLETADAYHRAHGETSQGLDLSLAHSVEVLGHGDLASQEAQSLRGRGGIQRRDLDQGLARLGDHERFAFDGLIDQLRELGLGFMDVDGNHDDLLRLS